MTNREKYKEKRDAYDMMMTIHERVPFDCPIDVVGGIPPFTDCREINLQKFKTCSDCVQKWLNQEADQPRPQW